MNSRIQPILRAGAFLLFSASLLAQPAGERPLPVYLIAPNDVIVVRAVNAEELSDKPFRVDLEGFLNLPLVGRIRAAGLTVEQLEAALTDALKKLIKEPQVAVSIVEKARAIDLQQAVSTLGAFKAPGVYPLAGRDTILDLLSRSGGLLPSAQRRIKLTRRADQGPIPLPQAVQDPGGRTGSVEISLTQAQEFANPAENIELKPFDVLSAARLEMIYVTGELGKTGAFALEDRDRFSVGQIVSLAGGLSRDADARNARVLRPVLNTSRRAEIPLDIRAILAGQAADFTLLPNDILFVPRGGGKSNVVVRMLMYAIPAAITSTVYVLMR